jgi:N utilization substance protein B
MEQQRARRGPIGHARRWSRRLAMQAVYQWQMTGQAVQEIDEQFQEEADLSKADGDYFHELLYGVLSHIDELDGALGPHMGRLVDHVDPVERAILRCACFELAHRPDVPYKVIINEAIELTKKFGSEQGHKFVNGVLDKVAPQLR